MNSGEIVAMLDDPVPCGAMNWDGFAPVDGGPDRRVGGGSSCFATPMPVDLVCARLTDAFGHPVERVGTWALWERRSATGAAWVQLWEAGQRGDVAGFKPGDVPIDARAIVATEYVVSDDIPATARPGPPTGASVPPAPPPPPPLPPTGLFSGVEAEVAHREIIDPDSTARAIAFALQRAKLDASDVAYAWRRLVQVFGPTTHLFDLELAGGSWTVRAVRPAWRARMDPADRRVIDVDGTVYRSVLGPTRVADGARLTVVASQRIEIASAGVPLQPTVFLGGSVVIPSPAQDNHQDLFINIAAEQTDPRPPVTWSQVARPQHAAGDRLVAVDLPPLRTDPIEVRRPVATDAAGLARAIETIEDSHADPLEVVASLRIAGLPRAVLIHGWKRVATQGPSWASNRVRFDGENWLYLSNQYRPFWRVAWGALGLDQHGAPYREVAGPNDPQFPDGLRPGTEVTIVSEIPRPVPEHAMTHNGHGTAFVRAAIVEPTHVDDATYAELVASNSDQIERDIVALSDW